ncbi:MAG: WD40 repeat domain-containing protein [Candidatus Bipolaricaulota bacterium]|nr:WD40 repeat domain-containing protein [Candidatus Bipolaricaulota bacterium]MDW8031695.1 WD40 repeat domain-containing protein [Candidatus Bipolaricaulota bacterium]
MRWRVWFGVGLMICALGSVDSSARESVQGGVWLEHAVWVKTYLNGRSLAYAPGSKLIATPGGFGQIFLYNALDGTLVRVLRGHEGKVTAVAFSPDGTKLASGDEFGMIRIWNVADGTVSHERGAHEAKVTGLLFSPDGSLLVSAGDEYKVKVWGTEGWCLVRQFERYATTASMAFSADGKLLALGDTIVQVFDWRAVRKLEYVSSLAFSPDGQFLALTSYYENIVIVRVSDWQTVRILQGHADDINYLSFSHDGKLLASASRDKTIALWDPVTGRVLRTMTRHNAPVNVVLFSDDDRQLISIGDDRAVRFWRTADGIQMREIRGDWPGPTYKIAVSPWGSLVAAAKDTEIHILNLADGQLVRTLTGHRASVIDLEFSPDRKILASSSCAVELLPDQSCPEGEIRLWDISRGQPIAVWDKGHGELVMDIAFSPDGQFLAAVDTDGNAVLWKVADGTETWRLSDSGMPVAFSPDGQLLALGSEDGIAVRRVTDGEAIITLRDYGVSAVFSSDGRMLITGGGYDNRIRFWDITTGELLRTLTWHTDSVFELGISPDGKRLVSGSADRTIKLWRIEDGSLIGSLLGYTGWVTSIAFSPDDKFVISAGEDGVALWNVDALR